MATGTHCDNMTSIVVRDRGIQVLRLRQTRRGTVVHSYAAAVLGTGVVENGTVYDSERLAVAIREACDAAAPYPVRRGAPVAFTLPESKTFMRVVTLPRMDDEEIADALHWEIEGYIPMPVDEVYYDWRVADTLENDHDMVSVLVMAAARTVVDAYIAAADGADVRLLGIEADSVADTRALADTSWKMQDVMIISCGIMHTYLAIVARGIPIFTVSIPVGHRTLISDASHALGMTTADAERLIATDGIGSYITHDPLFTAIEPGLAMLAEEIRRSAEFCKQELADCEHITKVILCGFAATTKGLRAYLVKATGLPVAIADPWINANLRPGIIPPVSQTAALDATSAIGLALRRFTYEDFS